MQRPYRPALALTCAVAALAAGAAIASAAPARHAARAAAQAVSADAPSWPMHRGSPAQAGVNTVETTLGPTNVQSLAVSFAFPYAGHVESSPAVVGGVLYASANDDTVRAIDALTGRQLWMYTTGGFVESSPAVVGGVVYVGSGDSHMYALNASNGALVWRTHTLHTHGRVQSSPIVANGLVYFGSADHYLYAVDATTGAIRWSSPTGGNVYSSPAVVNGIAYVGSGDDRLYAFDATSGALLWSVRSGAVGPGAAARVQPSFNPATGIFASPAVVAGRVYTESMDGWLTSRDAVSGHRIWRNKLGASRASVAVDGSTLFAVNRNGVLFAVSTATGTVQWRDSIDGSGWSSPTVANGVVYVGSGNGALYAFRESDGAELYESPTAAGLPMRSSPTVLDGRVYAGSNDGNLYAFALPAS
jgi:outer membrane protein assembly factor BamB